MGRKSHQHWISRLPDPGRTIRAGGWRVSGTGQDSPQRHPPAQRVAGLLDRFCAQAGDPTPEPSVLIVAAHPDDEVIGAGARLRRLRSAQFLHLTDGASPDGVAARAAGFSGPSAYARARRRELLQALDLAGIGPDRLRCFGLPDQSASRNLATLALRIVALLGELRPEIVLTHPYEGGHPDHDAAALAVHAASELRKRRGERDLPVIIEFTSYHAGASGMETSRFLDDRGVRVLALNAEDRTLKGMMLECFVTQRQMLSRFPVTTESFRPAPRYDFTRPPHPGRLWYEWFDWGMAGGEWRRNAAGALSSLGIAGPI